MAELKTIADCAKSIKDIEGKLGGLASKADLESIVDLVQVVLATQKVTPALPPVPAGPAIEDSDQVGAMGVPTGDFNEFNEMDPKLFVEIVMAPVKGVLPKVLDYRPDGKNLARFAPHYAKDGSAHYYVPRGLGTAQLANKCGMRWLLSWPAELTVSYRDSKLHKLTETVKADTNYPPIMIK